MLDDAHLKEEIYGLKDYLINNKLPENVRQFVNCMAVCNESKIIAQGHKLQFTGSVTEAAMKVLTENIGNYDNNLKRESSDPELYN